MKRLVLVLHLMAATHPSFAQTDSTLGYIFAKNHFSMILITNLTQKAKIVRTSGTAELFSKANFGFEV